MNATLAEVPAFNVHTLVSVIKYYHKEFINMFMAHILDSYALLLGILNLFIYLLSLVYVL